MTTPTRRLGPVPPSIHPVDPPTGSAGRAPAGGSTAATTQGDRGRMVDLRLAPVGLAVWAGTAAALLLGHGTLLIGAPLGLLGLAVGLGWPRRGTTLWRAAAVAALAAGAALAITDLHVTAARAGPVPQLAAAGKLVRLELVVESDPLRREPVGHRGPPYAVFTARVVSLSGRGTTERLRTPVVVTAPAAALGLVPGARARGMGRLAAARPHERAAALVAMRALPEVVAGPGPLHGGTARLRAGLRSAVARLPADERGLVPGLVLGDVTGFPPALSDAFRATGLTHLVAVSGTNVTILLGFVLGAARRLGVRAWVLPIAGTVAIGGFVLLARPEPSVLRAAVMGVVGLAALSTGRARRGLPALALAVAVLLVVDPWLALDYGFALSVLATGGIVLFGPLFVAALCRWLPRLVAEALAVPLAAQLACAPVIAVLSGTVSIAAIPANLLAAPAVTPATLAGMAATVAQPVLPPLATAFGALAGVAAWWIVTVARWGAALPGATLPWTADIGALTVLVIACLGAAAVAPVVLRSRLVTSVLVGLCVLALIRPAVPDAVHAPLSWARGWPVAGWVMVACDVGQGDALVLRTGPRAAVVVDTGPDPAAVDGCLRRIGIREVPVVVLTHFHADHVGGLTGVLRGRKVAEIAVGRTGAPGAGPAGVAAAAAAAGVPITPVTLGARRSVGDLSFVVLGPRRVFDTDAAAGEEGSAENDRSVVLLVRTHGIRILLTGDVEPAAQADLLASGADLAAEVLKVPHHGSRYQDPAFLAAVGARLAVVSVGADNDYGHPAERTLADLRADGASTERTDRDGDVAVTVRDGRLGFACRGGCASGR